MNISATILAAGASLRMGEQNKLLLPYKDDTIIGTVCKTLINSHLNPIYVVTGFESEKLGNSLPDSLDGVIFNEDWSSGMSASIIKAVSSLPNHIDGNMIVLGDMPLITVEIINKLREVYLDNNADKIIYADYMGNQANPVIFPKKFFNQILELNGDRGCKKLINKNKENSISVPIDSLEVIFDCDNEKDYSALVSSKIDNV